MEQYSTYDKVSASILRTMWFLRILSPVDINFFGNLTYKFVGNYNPKGRPDDVYETFYVFEQVSDGINMCPTALFRISAEKHSLFMNVRTESDMVFNYNNNPCFLAFNFDISLTGRHTESGFLSFRNKIENKEKRVSIYDVNRKKTQGKKLIQVRITNTDDGDVFQYLDGIHKLTRYIDNNGNIVHTELCKLDWKYNELNEFFCDQDKQIKDWVINNDVKLTFLGNFINENDAVAYRMKFM